MLKAKNIIWMVSGLIIISLAACENKPSGTLEGGMTYEFVTDVDGEKAKNGDYITFNVIYKNESDSVLGSTLEMGTPFVMRKDSLWGSTKSFEDCFNLMDKGDSAIFKIPAKALFKNQLPPELTEQSVITVLAGLEDILTEEQYREKVSEWQTIQRKKQMELTRKNILENGKELIEEQGGTIDQYLAENNLEAQTTESGIRYVISEQGSGEKPVAGDMVKVNYTGKLLDGTVFDTNDEEAAKAAGVHVANRPYQPFTFQLGVGQVIFGWDEGIGLLNVGSKATIFIPSPLAYGERGAGEKIKPNSILVFDVELLELMQ
ncbi:FKBP-type peptidyl-prolyl cis-trans isomerase [Fulvivirgaceae bacterium BMA12]|uniref:Peptidyl-prolyl cis-trans isomerase n=1 Tax=Agaribacillus aureus TaxID=3051825 RepID=A0ABT8LHF4_9BACT|nr:FKBP-type peptidyl-prolyl cis-trans isomerase [Fulvivirgaceae bacterium BMA12]